MEGLHRIILMSKEALKNPQLWQCVGGKERKEEKRGAADGCSLIYRKTIRMDLERVLSRVNEPEYLVEG